VIGDRYAHDELDAENAEAGRYPLGPKEFFGATALSARRLMAVTLIP
jgi:hypothetical protein